MNSPEQIAGQKKVVIVGGGLAGLAAAVGLAGRGLQVELLEAKQSLGGRAGSYRDAETGELIDHCQHVAMGCCTNFLDLCERTGCGDLLERHQRLHFFSAAGLRSDFAASRWLPAPLHLLPALLGMKHLNWSDKVGIGRAMLALMRMQKSSSQLQTNTAEWLNSMRQAPSASERFWKVVLVSALADSLDNIPLHAARKVFVDGFLAQRAAADVFIPRVSLGELYDQRMAGWLQSRGVVVRCGESVKQLARREPAGIVVQTANAEIGADYVILAVTWKQVRQLLDDTLLDESLSAAIPHFAAIDAFESSPIASVHLWTDRPIMNLPHAVLIDRLSQWVFARHDLDPSRGHYYQVVISASQELPGRQKQAVIDEVWQDLQAVFPAARAAALQTGRLITQRDAVFREGKSNSPRPSQRTNLPELILAGDWTDTGWPATMEGAVRSGYLAAEQVLKNLPDQSAPVSILKPDLPRGWLARWLLR